MWVGYYCNIHDVTNVSYYCMNIYGSHQWKQASVWSLVANVDHAKSKWRYYWRIIPRLIYKVSNIHGSLVTNERDHIKKKGVSQDKVARPHMDIINRHKNISNLMVLYLELATHGYSLSIKNKHLIDSQMGI